MKKYIIVLGIITLFFSCKNDKKEKDSIEPHEFETENVLLDSTNLKACQDRPCPDVTVGYIKVKGDSEFSQVINDKNTEELVQIFNSSDEDENEAENVEEAANGFIEDYFKFKEEYSDSQASYEADIEQKVKSKNESTIVLQTKFYLFTGGAHGYSGTQFRNYDAHTGELLSHKDLISDIDGFTDFIEGKFREKYDIPPNASINSQGYFFEDDKFILPENISVTDKEVILLYNPYEAASYAEGQLRFMFPKKAVKKWFKY